MILVYESIIYSVLQFNTINKYNWLLPWFPHSHNHNADRCQIDSRGAEEVSTVQYAPYQGWGLFYLLFSPGGEVVATAAPLNSHPSACVRCTRPPPTPHHTLSNSDSANLFIYLNLTLLLISTIKHECLKLKLYFFTIYVLLIARSIHSW